MFLLYHSQKNHVQKKSKNNMELDKIYIEESIRIRKDYVYNIKYVNDLEPVYQKLLLEFQKAKNIIDDIDYDETDERYNKDFFIKMMEELNTHIEETTNKIKPYIDAIKKLDEDQKVLYYSIKEKYPNITDKEMENAIVPYIYNIL